MAGVFISYRRDDTSAYARDIGRRLAARYGKHRVFMDLDSIPLATRDFRERISEAMGSSSALVAIIGRDWLTEADSTGRPRIQDPGDWVRAEIATAIQMNKVIIPVMVEGATPPSADNLPEPLKPLAYIQGLKTSEQDWDYHLTRLVRTIEDNTELRPGDSRTKIAYGLMLAGIAARVIGGLDPVQDEGVFVSWDLALIATVAVILAIVARRNPLSRLLAAGLVVGAGIGTILRFGQQLIGSNLQFGQSGDAIPATTLLLYYLGLASGLLLVAGGTVLYLSTPREGLRPPVAAAVLGLLALAVLVVSIVASSEEIFIIRGTHSPAVVPAGLAVVTLVGLIGMLSSPGFGPMGTGFLIVFGLQAILRYVHDLGTAQEGTRTTIGLVAGALLVAAGILGALQILTQARRDATAYGVT
jgi:TIR domain